ncbi:LuxR family transcriptional regulator [Nocardia farcinica]|uniref:response regulator transcription factor n=1 Tax=Nocardia farcinica TaxID=37329 RepID=UPI000A3A3155|nr:helix-turn-helix transcriptional regulator [Nocardia farcinica]SUE28888.1 LuxR family transcriptional regulator [Nocardia farcinica]
MSGYHGHIARIDAAVAAVTEASDRDTLATVLCSAVAAVTGARTVVLSEGTFEAREDIARFDSPGAALGLHPIQAGQTVHDDVRRRTDLDPRADGSPVTVFEIEPDAGHTLLLVDGTLTAEVHENVQLLIDLAVVTAERLDSQERLRDRQLRLRTLGEQLRLLDAGTSGTTPPSSERAAEFASAAALLTDRERDILESMLQGASNADIARAHTLSVETVKTHVKNILRKMGAANRAELIARSG